MKKVEIYTTPTCGYCKMTKAFFQENNIKYQEYDVASNQAKAEEMMAKSGQMGVPVIVITDEQSRQELIIGYDKPKLTKALGIK